MDDETIRDDELEAAYDRLGTALAPPADVADRVEQIVRGRRRRRRTTVAGAALVVAASAVTGVVVARSGDDGTHDAIATDPGGPQGSFTLTRQDGTSVTFDDFTVSCDKNPMGATADHTTVNLWSPFLPDKSGEKLTEPYVYIAVGVDSYDGKTVRLPVEDGQEVAPFIVFAAEADPGDEKDANEVSSAEGGAAGTVHVIRAACDPVPVLEIEVDATLGSELDQPTETLTGSYR